MNAPGREGGAGRLIFVANGVYGDPVGGGEVHFFHMARAAEASGLTPVYIGGHALGDHLRRQGLRGEWWPSDAERLALPPGAQARLSGQCRLFGHYVQKYRATRRLLARNLAPGDRLYAISDFWFDLLPVAQAAPVRKALMLEMLAATWADLALGRRPDLRAGRLAALHYRLSQSVGFRRFRRCRGKRVFYVHPDMKETMRRCGFAERELVFLTNGVDLDGIRSAGHPRREYDAAWIGRLHRQKGLDPLADALNGLACALPGFRAVVIGDVEPYLRPRLGAEAARATVFTGVVTGVERFRLLRSAQVMLMPSLHESWGIVIAEALACRTPVVAFDLPAYRAPFGDLIGRVPCYDTAAFTAAARIAVERARAGDPLLDEAKVQAFSEAHDWKTIGRRFTALWADSEGGWD